MRKRRSHAASIVALIALFPLLTAREAVAQPISQADTLAAESLFREAKDLAAAGKTREACPKFAESQRLDPQIGTLLHLATCHAQEGKTATAWAEFLQAADTAGRAHDDARAKLARERADKLAPTVPRILLEIDPANPPLEINLDGQRVRASAGVPIPIDPGAHTLAASAPSRLQWSKQITVRNQAGTETIQVPTLETSLAPDASSAAPQPAPTTTTTTTTSTGESRPSGGTLRYVGYGAAALGVVGIGVGTVFGVKSISNKNASDDACDARGCTEAGLASYEDARSTATICNIALGVGVVALVAGVVIILTTPSASSASAARRSRPWLISF